MPESVLNSTKKALGLDPAYAVFDEEIKLHINSVFATLRQLGVGPSETFFISDDTETWESFLAGQTELNSVKSYMYLKLRLLFDPPSTSFALDSMKKQAEEFEWRLNVAAEGEA